MKPIEPVAGIDVATDVVRQYAGSLLGIADRLAGATAEVPELLVAIAGWAAPSALAELELAARAELDLLGAQTAEAAARVRTAAEAYQAADERAAHRLRATTR